MPFKLKNMLIDRVDLVDKGANPDAQIVLFKRDGGDDVLKIDESILNKFENRLKNAIESLLTKKGADKMPEEFDVNKFLESLPEEQRPEVKARFDKVAALEVDLAKKDEDIDKLTKEIEALAKNTPNDPESTDIWKGVNPEIKKMFEQQQQKADEAEKLAKKLEEDQKNASFIQKAAEFKALPLKSEELGPIFKRINDQNPDDYAKIEAFLKSVNNLLEENNEIMKTVGSSQGSDAGKGAWDVIIGKAKNFMANDSSLTQEAAINKVLQLEPGLYEEYEKQLEMEVQ